MNNYNSDFEEARLLSQVLTLYYVEEKRQAEIGKLLNLSTAKVNRLLKQAREKGMVRITIQTPFQHLFDLARQLQSMAALPEAVIVPKLSEDPKATLQSVGQAAANYLVDRLRDGDTICISGGKAMEAIVQSVSTQRKFDIRVVPATGGVQGRHFTDVNYLATQLAARLGGTAYQLHAPLFVDSRQERDTLLAMRQTSEILDMARNAQVALLGIGSIEPDTSSYFEMASVDDFGRKKIIEAEEGKGDLFARIFNIYGQPCAREYNDQVVGLNFDELAKIPLRIGVAASDEKVIPILGALRGQYFKTLVTDEATARSVLNKWEI